MNDIYTIDEATKRRGSIIDIYESFIWTERFAKLGDFELKVRPTQEMLSNLAVDKLVGFDQSDRIMVINSVDNTEDEEGKRLLTVKGRSYESILDGRVALKVGAGLNWFIVDEIANIASTVVKTVCIDGQGLSTNDIIPGLSVHVAMSSPAVSTAVKFGSIYERVNEWANAYGYGFKIILPTVGVNALEFWMYSGTDKTDSVFFGQDLDTLSETTMLRANDNYKNVAYVKHSSGVGRIVNIGSGSSATGIARKVVTVDASDITNQTGQALLDAMYSRGMDALSQHKAVDLFDGQVPAVTPFEYKTHYDLGDLVSLRNEFNVSTVVRVTEYIWSSSNDAEGFRSFPTLSNIEGS